jgi:hypothetical protein
MEQYTYLPNGASIANLPITSTQPPKLVNHVLTSSPVVWVVTTQPAVSTACKVTTLINHQNVAYVPQSCPDAAHALMRTNAKWLRLDTLSISITILLCARLNNLVA